MTLTEVDIDEISDKVLHITKDTWNVIEDKYKAIMKKVQWGMQELKVLA